MEKEYLIRQAPAKALLAFSTPMIIGNLFQQLYTMTDSVIVGQAVGESALAAVGASYALTNVFISIAIGGGVGASVLTSQAFGRRDYHRMKRFISTALFTFLAVSLLLGGFGLAFSGQIMAWLRTPASILDDAAVYLNIYFLGLPFLFMYNVLSAMFNALGRSKVPLYLLIFSSVLNVGLDLYLVLTLKMGVAGVAWATLIAQGVSAVAAFLLFARELRAYDAPSAVCFDVRELKNMARVALPSVFQQSTVSIGMMLVQSVVNSFGAETLAGYSAAMRIESICTVPMAAVGNAMSSYTAQNIGANKPERIKQGFRSVLIFSLATALVFFLLFFLLNQPLLSLFMNEDGSQLAMDTGVNFLRIAAPFYFIVCLKLLCDGVLRGSESMGCFMAATFTDLILRVVLAAILSNAMNDVTGIWYSWPGAWAVATVMSVIFYKSGIWAKKLRTLTPEAEKEEIAEEELVDEILEEHVDMTPDK